MMNELRQQLEDRVEVLKRERELGEQRLQTVQQESFALQQTLLRISGAIQVLHEVLETDQPPLPADHTEPASENQHELSDHRYASSATSG